MDADALRAYKKRWEKVAEIERAEVERMSAGEKLADIAMLMDVARGLGGAGDGDDEVEVVRRRWNRLAERLGV
jgi:hypothetical protein